jgi:hypothetical protein
MNENLAQILDGMLDESFRNHIGTSVKFASDTLNKFKALYEKELKITDISKIYNACIYEWYYGTIIHKLLLFVFQPYLFLDFKNKYDTILSKIQILDILSVIYYILINNNCDVTIKDYYECSVIEILMLVEKNANILPNELKEYLSAFKFLTRYGNRILNIQQMMIRKYVHHITMKKKRAVSTIEKYYLELILNPDTEYGKKKINQLAMRFNANKIS